jgi:A/G-specific adenine glycosylase
VRELPVVVKKRPPARRHVVAIIAQDTPSERLLLQRSETGLFAGLWNLPMAEGRDRAAAKALLDTLGVRARLDSQPLAELEHVLTHRHLIIQLFRARLTDLDAPSAQAKHLRLQPRGELEQLGVSALTRKALGYWPPRAGKDLVHAKRSESLRSE